jgi:hypothetical protein
MRSSCSLLRLAASPSESLLLEDESDEQLLDSESEIRLSALNHIFNHIQQLFP